MDDLDPVVKDEELEEEEYDLDPLLTRKKKPALHDDELDDGVESLDKLMDEELEEPDEELTDQW